MGADDLKEKMAAAELRPSMSYSDYLQLDKVLTAQAPISASPDELLFIIQHQTSELWMKLAISELRGAMQAVAADELRPAFKKLTRVARIFEQLNNAWDVLRTMTPSEYTSFRAVLGQSSEPDKYWGLYELAEKLVDFEDYFRRWRFNHVTTVERIIGMKRGTGGTSGVSYLRKMLDVELFPELWHLRTEL